MNITLGVYDVFTYAVPGSLYLTLLTYIADQLGWVDPARIFQGNTTLIVITGAVLSYLLGHVTYPIGEQLARRYPRNKSISDAVNEFIARVPSARDRAFVKADRFTLQAAIEIHDVGAAADIARNRAIGLMLRNCALVFVLGAVAATVEAVIGNNPAIAVCCAALFLLIAAGCLSQAAIIRHWANLKTLQLAFWIPDIDNTLVPKAQSSRQSSRSNRPAGS
jgi:hypothetical protein